MRQSGVMSILFYSRQIFIYTLFHLERWRYRTIRTIELYELFSHSSYKFNEIHQFLKVNKGHKFLVKKCGMCQKRRKKCFINVKVVLLIFFSFTAFTGLSYFCMMVLMCLLLTIKVNAMFYKCTSSVLKPK